jgi:hypothetical protein
MATTQRKTLSDDEIVTRFVSAPTAVFSDDPMDADPDDDGGADPPDEDSGPGSDPAGDDAD